MDCYRFIEHTADIGISCQAEDLPGLFYQNCRAVYNLIYGGEINEICSRTDLRRNFAYNQKGALDIILHDFLERLVADNDIENSVLAEPVFSFDGGKDEWLFECRGWYVISNREKMEYIKAVTYHNLYVQKKDGVWESMVIMDL